MTTTDDRMARRVDVYTPTPTDKKRWKEAAAKKGMTLSKWIIAVVEETLQQDENARPRQELLKEIRDLKENISQLREKNKQYEIVIDKLERELRGYRIQPFLTPGFKGVRKFDKELIQLLRETRGHDGKPKAVKDEDILQYLGVGLNETDVLKGVSHQLDVLESYGLLESTPKGWRWKE